MRSLPGRSWPSWMRNTLTTLRTGATSAVATRPPCPPRAGRCRFARLGVEARAQLEAMQADGKVGSARIFSPTAANRERLAEDFRKRYDMEVTAVGSAEEAGFRGRFDSGGGEIHDTGPSW